MCSMPASGRSRIWRVTSTPPSTSLNAWCELSGEDLRGRCPRSRVGLLPDPEGKGTDSSHGRCGHLPHYTLRYGRRLLPLPFADKETRPASIAVCKRGDHPGHLRSVGAVPLQTRLLP